MCASGVSSRCESPVAISNQSRDVRAMAGVVSRLSTAAGPLGGRKRKGETPTGEFVTSYTVSRSIRQAREMVERCCSCTRHSTCSAAGPSARACKCRNAGRQCTGCYLWGKCCNKGRLMPSPTTARVLLWHFPWGADPPANKPRATTPPVRSPTSLSLREILAAGDGGRSARGGASGRRGLREVGRGGEGGKAESKEWIGGIDSASDADTEEEGWVHTPLTTSPCDTQESGARGLQGNSRAGGSDGWKVPSATANEAETQGRHGVRREQGAKREASREGI